MNRTKKAARNVGFNVFGQIVSLFLTFIARTFFIRCLGETYLGINGLFNDLLSLLSMADLGFNVAMVYSFYKPLADHDYDKMAGLTCFFRKVYLLVGIAIAIVGICLFPFLPQIINLEIVIDHLTLYYLLALLNVVCSYLFIYKTSILTADQNNYLISVVSTISQVVQTTLQIGLIYFHHSYLGYLIVGIIFTVVKNICCSFIAEKKYPFIKKKYELEKAEKKNILLTVFSSFIYKAVNVILNATDNIIISIIIGTVYVGYYSNYQLIQTKVILLYALIFTSLTATVGNVVVTETAEKRYFVFECEQSISFLASCLIVPCYYVLVNDFILIWIGEEYVLSNNVVIAICINIYLSCVLQPLWTFREATGLYKKTKWVMVACGVLNIVLSVAMGEVYGILGVIIASAISRLVTYVWYEPKLLFDSYFNREVMHYYLSIIVNIIIVIGISVTCYYCCALIDVYDWKRWFLKAFWAAVICMVTSIIIYSRSEGFGLLRRYLKSMFIKKA